MDGPVYYIRQRVINNSTSFIRVHKIYSTMFIYALNERNYVRKFVFRNPFTAIVAVFTR